MKRNWAIVGMFAVLIAAISLMAWAIDNRLDDFEDLRQRVAGLEEVDHVELHNSTRQFNADQRVILENISISGDVQLMQRVAGLERALDAIVEKP
jgi:hypothetical protein